MFGTFVNDHSRAAARLLDIARPAHREVEKIGGGGENLARLTGWVVSGDDAAAVA